MTHFELSPQLSLGRLKTFLNPLPISMWLCMSNVSKKKSSFKGTQTVLQSCY